MLNTAITDYPRETATATAVGVGAYKGISGYKQAYKEGLDLVRNRVREEQATIKALEKKGISGISRLTGSNTDTVALAREYAKEKIFSRFPFYNAKAQARLNDIKEGRVILTGETVAGVRPRLDLTRSPATVTTIPYETSVGVAQTPKQVTVATAKGIPKLKINAPSTTGNRPRIDLNSPNWSEKTQPRRIASAPEYVSRVAPNPRLTTRVAELSTGGKFGKANVGLEALGVANDIFDSEGNIQRSIREGNRYGGLLGGTASGILTTLSRAGRGASNALTLGAPEYLGIYDTIDIAQAGSEGERRYLANRKSLGQPSVVNSDNPYLQMFQAQAMAEKEIQKSPVISDFYKGPEYDYKVIDGKLEAILNPLYGAVYDAQSLADLDRYSQSRSMFNVDPRFGNIGYQSRTPSAFNFGDYTEYMQDR
jgi:hypothetical protein